MTKRPRSTSQSPVRRNSDMEAFYASLVVDQNTKPNNESSVRTTPSEETQKAMKTLQDFMSKKFSLLFHSGRFIVMQDTLKDLLKLKGFSTCTKSVMLQLSRSCSRWYFDYDHARLKFVETATATPSKAEKLKRDLEANVQDFQEMDKEDKSLSDELSQLQKEKKELEEKISAVKTNIAIRTETRDNVAKKKMKLFHEGRVVKAELDDLENRAERLKAEQEWAKATQANIEAEWSKLGAELNRCVGLEKWI